MSSRILILYCYYKTSELWENLKLKETKAVRINQLSMKLWVWSGSLNFELKFLLRVFLFYILYYQNFWPRMFGTLSSSSPLDRILWLNSYSTLSYSIIQTWRLLLCSVPIFNTTHKMACCKYWYCMGWYN